MLREIDQNIWVGERQFQFFGLEVGTRMTVIRLDNGELIIISPIDVDEITIQQINALGNVITIIAPNCYHHLFLTNFKEIYPNAEIWTAPGLDLKRPDITSDRIFNERGKIGNSNEVEYLLFAGFQTIGIGGSGVLNEIVFWHRASQTLILTDTAFHFDASFPWQMRLVAKILGGDRSLEPTLLEKLASRDKERVKQSIQKVLCWDFHRVIMAHGSIIERDGKRQLQAGYEKFLSTKNLQIAR
ncbi:DUF4336 domain-containing protein [Chroococcidiopsis sp. FACHB-1243]|uniref:DUF4336 domain-containing protein n=1 Tax=Chroococcidiopsis sp. [FACHB-1243] TaxID=2692781 RepID=UPI001783D874|nr:DUF4336 domain-containing protein [Chroococcidiopsis sp. [FACHB-1243]]MBD2307015.1 DUF4336 domain-containing protein [Chroococcidiopsis sp. [FACHB-1243]]